MSTNAVRTDDATSDTKVKLVDMKLEVIVIPVSDVDRPKNSTGGSGGGSMPSSPTATTSP